MDLSIFWKNERQMNAVFQVILRMGYIMVNLYLQQRSYMVFLKILLIHKMTLREQDDGFIWIGHLIAELWIHKICIGGMVTNFQCSLRIGLKIYYEQVKNYKELR